MQNNDYYIFLSLQPTQIPWLPHIDQPKGERSLGTCLGARLQVEELRESACFVSSQCACSIRPLLRAAPRVNAAGICCLSNV